MKAIVYDAPGNPARLRPAELPVPRPDRGQVRIRVAACGINPIDINPIDIELSRTGVAG